MLTITVPALRPAKGEPEMSRVLRALAAALGLAVIVAGCSAEEPTPTVAGFADATAISQEYDDTKSSLDLPDGETWPPVSFDGEAYSTGYGTQRAYEIWQCAWSGEAVSGGDSASRQAAVDALAGFLKTEQFAGLDAARRDIFETAVADATDGDEDGLRDYIEASCEGLV